MAYLRLRTTNIDISLSRALAYEAAYFAKLPVMAQHFQLLDPTNASLCGAGNGGTNEFPRPWAAEIQYRLFISMQGLAEVIRFTAQHRPENKQAYIDFAWTVIDTMVPLHISAAGTIGCSVSNSSLTFSSPGERYPFLAMRGLTVEAELLHAIWHNSDEQLRVEARLLEIKSIYDVYDGDYPDDPANQGYGNTVSESNGSAASGDRPVDWGFWTVSTIPHIAGILGDVFDDQSLTDRFCNHLREMKESTAFHNGDWFKGTHNGFTQYPPEYLDMGHMDYFVATINFDLHQQSVGKSCPNSFTSAEVAQLANTFCQLFVNASPGEWSGRHLVLFAKWVKFAPCLDDLAQPLSAFTFPSPGISGFDIDGDMGTVANLVSGYSYPLNG